MATEHDKDEFVPVNQILNAKPRLGPIPGEQVVAWIGIIVVSYLICQGLLGLSWIATCLVAAWGMGTWWALTGDESWRFLSKFHGVPRWTLGNQPYTSLLEKRSAKRSHKPSRKRRKR
jgi:hypothetical protein